MHPAPKMGFLHLVSDLERASLSHIFILEGDAAERAGLASALASHLGRQIHQVNKDENWQHWIAGIPASDQPSWILFFDEADALFGKRTAVQDSHQQYAELNAAFRGLIFLGVDKSYTLPSVFTQCARPITVRSYWP